MCTISVYYAPYTYFRLIREQNTTAKQQIVYHLNLKESERVEKTVNGMYKCNHIDSPIYRHAYGAW